MESAVEIIYPAKKFQEMGVRQANARIGPRPRRRAAFHERRICKIEYQPLTIRGIGERIGAEKLRIRRSKHKEVAGRQAREGSLSSARSDIFGGEGSQRRKQ